MIFKHQTFLKFNFEQRPLQLLAWHSESKRIVLLDRNVFIEPNNIHSALNNTIVLPGNYYYVVHHLVFSLCFYQ